MLASNDISLLQETCYLLFDPKPLRHMPMHLHLHSFFFVIVLFSFTVCYCCLIRHRSHCTYATFLHAKTHSLEISGVQIAFVIGERERSNQIQKRSYFSHGFDMTRDSVYVCDVYRDNVKSQWANDTHTDLLKEHCTSDRFSTSLSVSLALCYGCVKNFPLFLLLRFEPDRKNGCKRRVLHDTLRNRIKFMWIKMKWETKSFVGISCVINTPRDLNTFALLWQFSIDVYCDLFTKLITHKSSSLPYSTERH